MTALTCSACKVTVPADNPYRDDEGRHLCPSCYWKSASA